MYHPKFTSVPTSFAFLESASYDLESLKESPQDQKTVAVDIRNDRLFRKIIIQETVDHTIGLVTKLDCEKASMAYDASYLLSLDLPYSGISYLCSSLVSRCIAIGYSSYPDVWVKFSQDDFDWSIELDRLSNVEAL